MVNATISADQTGLYEQPITAGTATTIAIKARNTYAPGTIEIINHGTGPIYVRLGDTITLRDTAARIIGPGGWLENYLLPLLDTATISLISSSDTTISIART